MQYLKRIRFSHVLPYLFCYGLLIGGCATPSQHATQRNSCLATYKNWDDQLAQMGAQDIQTLAINGNPQWRYDRPLAQLLNNDLSAQDRDNWRQHARRLSAEHYQVSLPRILPAHKIKPALRQLNACADMLDTFHTRSGRDTAIASAHFPDDYISGWRAVGVYPASSALVRNGIAELHEQLNTAAQAFQQADITTSKWRHYHPAQPELRMSNTIFDDLWQQWRDSTDGALPGLPNKALLSELYLRNAPTFAVETTSNADKIGSPSWPNSNSKEPQIDTDNARVYTHWGLTRFAGKTLLQLNYTIWFPERPKQSQLDITAGKLDGLVWRITLDENAKPLLADSIHNCGCYHSFAPTKGLNTLLANTNEEPLFTLKTPDNLSKVNLLISSGEHYLLNIRQATPNQAATNYQLDSYNALRMLPVPSQQTRRSLFDNRGFVPGSDRTERFVLWPMGIERAGSMRQWGHHATAFIGRRHFDELHLIDRYFTNK